MPKKKIQREAPRFHAEPEKKIIVKPPHASPEPPELESVLWRDIAPDTFAPDKPDQELDQIMSYRDTHVRKDPSKRLKRKKNSPKTK